MRIDERDVTNLGIQVLCQPVVKHRSPAKRLTFAGRGRPCSHYNRQPFACALVLAAKKVMALAPDADKCQERQNRKNQDLERFKNGAKKMRHLLPKSARFVWRNGARMH